MEKIRIQTETIKLGQFLKLAGCVVTGTEAKAAIENKNVQVNGEIEERRGKKLRAGDIVTYQGRMYEVLGE